MEAWTGHRKRLVTPPPGPPPPSLPAPPVPVRALPAVPSTLGLAPRGLRLAPEPLTAQNVARLAEAGYVDAMFAWGLGRLTGDAGIARDPADGRRWLERAAGAGFPHAALELARALDQGEHGLPRDPEAAGRWLSRGVELGSPECMALLGVRRLQTGRPEDDRAGLELLELAHQAGLRDARLLLAELLCSDRSVADAKRGAALLREAAEAGDAPCMARLAQVLQAGLPGLPADPAGALRWWRAAADLDDPDGLFGLGMAHELGLLGLTRRWPRRAGATSGPRTATRRPGLGWGGRDEGHGCLESRHRPEVALIGVGAGV